MLGHTAKLFRYSMNASKLFLELERNDIPDPAKVIFDVDPKWKRLSSKLNSLAKELAFVCSIVFFRS